MISQQGNCPVLKGITCYLTTEGMSHKPAEQLLAGAAFLSEGRCMLMPKMGAFLNSAKGGREGRVSSVFISSFTDPLEICFLDC